MTQQDRPDLLTGIRNGQWLDEQEFPPLKWAVPGLIPEGLTLLAGPPKAGKSFLALDLLLAVSGGGAALGRIPCGEPRPVLYLALEDSDRRMQERCRIVLNRQRIPTLFAYITRVSPSLVVPTIRQALETRPDIAVVWLDTLGKMAVPQSPGESAYQRDYRVGGMLKDITDDHPGLALVTNVHDRKAAADDFVQAINATQGLAGAADAAALLARPRGETCGVIKITGRDVAEDEYAVEFVQGDLGPYWQLGAATLSAAAREAAIRRSSEGLGDRSSDIVAYVEHYGSKGVRRSDVAEALGIDPDQASTYLTRLASGGRIRRGARGLYLPVSSVPSVRSDGTLHTQITGGYLADSDAWIPTVVTGGRA